MLVAWLGPTQPKKNLLYFFMLNIHYLSMGYSKFTKTFTLFIKSTIVQTKQPTCGPIVSAKFSNQNSYSWIIDLRYKYIGSSEFYHQISTNGTPNKMQQNKGPQF